MTYLPPEVVIGLIRPNTSDDQSSGEKIGGNPTWDVWSLGIILLEVIIGKPLFKR